MNRKALLLTFIFLFSVLYFPGNTTSDPGDFIIFRAQVAEMYIENATAQVRVRAVYYSSDSLPQAKNILIPYEIDGYNYTYKSEITISSGHEAMINLPGMHRGKYSITIHAEAEGITSETLKQDFAVSPAPLPYVISLSDDGAHLYFSSRVLNESGAPDPNITFTIEIYQYVLHAGEMLIIQKRNVTTLDFDIPATYQHGIVIIEVYDRYGWRNGNGVNIANAVYAGPPIQYDYDYEYREPYASRSLFYGISAFVAIIFMYVFLNYLRKGGERDV